MLQLILAALLPLSLPAAVPLAIPIAIRSVLPHLLTSAKKSRAAEPSAPAAAAASYDKYLNALTSLGRFSGAVLVARDGKIEFRSAYGYADVEKRTPFIVESQIEIASLSKMFTARAILKLRDAGKLKLGDSVCDHMHDCPDAWRPITIEELLRHTSGIPDYEDALELDSPKYLAYMTQPDSSRRILENAVNQPLDFPPGSKFKYSNTGYVVLGYVIEQASGEPFGKFMDDEILKPAGMSHSGIFGYGAPPAHLAIGYTHGDTDWSDMLRGVRLEDEHLTALPQLPLTPPHGDAGMFSTIDDLYAWSVAMDGGALVPASLSAEIFSPGRDGYGYGWAIGEEYGDKRYQHIGLLPGYDSALIKFPDQRITIVVASNLDRIRLGTISSTLDAIALGKPWDMPVTGDVIRLDAAQQVTLAGDYKLADGRMVTIAADGDSVSLQVKDKFLAGLIPLTATRFYMPMSDGVVTFLLGSDGHASAINLHYKGEDHIGPLVTP
ncbi:MAG: serine hydrolase domain-containing protein [Candidatus Acidiferrales bacterium]